MILSFSFSLCVLIIMINTIYFRDGAIISIAGIFILIISTSLLLFEVTLVGWDADNFITHSIDFYNNSTSSMSRTYKNLSYYLYIPNVIGDSFKEVKYLALLFNSILITQSVVFMITLNEKSISRVNLTPLLYFILPSSFLMASTITREPLILFSLVVFVYALIDYSKRQRLGYMIFLIVLSVLLMYLFKPVYILAMFLSLIGYFTSRFIFNSFLLLSFILFFTYIGEVSFLNYFNKALAARDIGGAAYLVGMHYNSIADWVFSIPIRFAYFAFGVSLYDFRSISDFIMFIESMIFLYMFYFLYKRRKYIYHSKINSIILFLIIFLMFMGAMVDSNYGTAIRHKWPSLMLTIFLFLRVRYCFNYDVKKLFFKI
jgi:hypothetical protein